MSEYPPADIHLPFPRSSSVRDKQCGKHLLCQRAAGFGLGPPQQTTRLLYKHF